MCSHFSLGICDQVAGVGSILQFLSLWTRIIFITICYNLLSNKITQRQWKDRTTNKSDYSVGYARQHLAFHRIPSSPSHFFLMDTHVTLLAHDLAYRENSIHLIGFSSIERMKNKDLKIYGISTVSWLGAVSS